MATMWPGDDDFAEVCEKKEEAAVQQLKVQRTGKMVSIFHYEDVCATYSTMVLPWLYIGNAKNAASAEEMLKIPGHVMTHCLNCRQNGKTPHKSIQYKVLTLTDEPAEDLIPQVNKAFDFLEVVRKKYSDDKSSKVLVHCDGVKDGGKLSRSSAILLGYLMKKDKKRYKQAWNELKVARNKQYQKMCEPNHGFVQQLKKMYKTLS